MPRQTTNLNNRLASVHSPNESNKQARLDYARLGTKRSNKHRTRGVRRSRKEKHPQSSSKNKATRAQSLLFPFRVGVGMPTLGQITLDLSNSVPCAKAPSNDPWVTHYAPLDASEAHINYGAQHTATAFTQIQKSDA